MQVPHRRALQHCRRRREEHSDKAVACLRSLRDNELKMHGFVCAAQLILIRHGHSRQRVAHHSRSH